MAHTKSYHKHVRFVLMRIVIATPLYPPEIAGPAPYIKELARRLSKDTEVTIVAYARLPEQVPGVHIIAVDKRRPLPLRLFAYLRALARAARDADAIYAINGASVELPVLIVSFFSRTPLFFGIGDRVAHERAKKRLLFLFLERIAFARSRGMISKFPWPRPKSFRLSRGHSKRKRSMKNHGARTL